VLIPAKRCEYSLSEAKWAHLEKLNDVYNVVYDRYQEIRGSGCFYEATNSDEPTGIKLKRFMQRRASSTYVPHIPHAGIRDEHTIDLPRIQS